jgi:hypothetical protein
LLLTQLRQEESDLARLVQDSCAALRKTESIHSTVVAEDLAERRRIRKELVYYGIAAPHPSDPPFSPMVFPAAVPFAGNGAVKGVNRSNGAVNKSKNANRTAIARYNARVANGQVNPPLPSFPRLDGLGGAGDEGEGGGLNGRRSGSFVSADSSSNLMAGVVSLSPEKVGVAGGDSRRRGGVGGKGGAVSVGGVDGPKLSPDAWKSIDLEEHALLKNEEKKLVQHMSVSELRSKLLARNIPFDYREIKTILLKRYIAYVMLAKVE